MSIPDAAIEAAAEAAYTSMYVGSNIAMLPWKSLHSITRNREIDRARAALEAAMPAIREALAQEIEAEAEHRDWSTRYAQGHNALTDAARIVRGGTP